MNKFILAYYSNSGFDFFFVIFFVELCMIYVTQSAGKGERRRNKSRK